MTAGACPVPVRPTLSGLSPALSVNCRLAVRLPAAVGVKLTETVQFAPAAKVAEPVGQVLVCPKSVAFEPVIAIPLIESGAVPVFVSVTPCVALVVPTS